MKWMYGYSASEGPGTTTPASQQVIHAALERNGDLQCGSGNN